MSHNISWGICWAVGQDSVAGIATGYVLYILGIESH